MTEDRLAHRLDHDPRDAKAARGRSIENHTPAPGPDRSAYGRAVYGLRNWVGSSVGCADQSGRATSMYRKAIASLTRCSRGVTAR